MIKRTLNNNGWKWILFNKEFLYVQKTDLRYKHIEPLKKEVGKMWGIN